MKKIMINLVLLFVVVFVFAQLPEWQWAKQAGGIYDDSGSNVIFNADNSLYVSGLFNNSATFGSTILTDNDGWGDGFVSKIDNDGNWQWTSQICSSGFMWDKSIISDSNNNLYVTGAFENTISFGTTTLISDGAEADIFIAKINSDGNWEWAVKAGGTSFDSAECIAIDLEGKIFVSGSFRGSVDFGTTNLMSNGISDIFIAELDQDGNWLQCIQIGGNEWDSGDNITFDSTGHLLITGSFANSITFGSTILTCNDLMSSFIAKMDQQGNWVWAIQINGNDYFGIQDIAIDNCDNLCMTGSFENQINFDSTILTSIGERDVFVAKTDLNGNWLWVNSAGDENQDITKSIICSPDSKIYLSGYFYNSMSFGTSSMITSNGNRDIFVAKIDEYGNWIWGLNVGSDSYDIGYDLSNDLFGNLYVTGYISNSVYFGSNEITSFGNNDIFIAKLSEELIANFVAKDTSIYLGSQVQFIDDSSLSVLNWFWDFQNDGIYDSFVQNPTYIYNTIGTFNVKLKVSNATFVDSLIKESFITVEYVPPKLPQNIQIQVSGYDVIISWDPVTTDINENPFTPDGYFVFMNSDPNNPDDQWSSNFTPLTNYTHTFGTYLNDKMFYKVKAFKLRRNDF